MQAVVGLRRFGDVGDESERVVPFDGAHLFETLVERHYRNLHIFAISLTRNPSDAADLTQEAFTRWANKGTHVTDLASAKSWLYRTLYRAFIDLKRRQNRIQPLESVAGLDPPSCCLEAGRASDGGTVSRALQTLPEKYRIPLVLFYLEDCSYKEIAKVTNLRIGTVMSRLARGKQKLAELLEDPTKE